MCSARAQLDARRIARLNAGGHPFWLWHCAPEGCDDALPTTLSPSLRALLDERVNSFEKLELVMALRRAPGQQSTVRDLASVLESERDEVRGLLDHLVRDGLVEVLADGNFELAPKGADAVAIDELAAQYTADKIVIVMTIAESAMDRLRNLAGRAFAEAFVIRKKPGGDDDR